ncbi:MAG TPA: hypothetical protein EYQ01_10110 [Nitrospira sp.]|jgi:chromosome partitioning protein|nr:hypothetical protein [Candidatus Manganitrophaceae bacterium]
MIITICNGKGGAGKTTLTVLLACAFTDAGRNVAVLDRDPQATASRWIQESTGIKLAQEGESYDILLIDTPPRLDSPLLVESLQRSDKAVLISSPSPADLWTSQDTAKIIKQHLPNPEKVRLLFNQVQKNTLLGRGLESMAEQIGVPRFENHLSRKQAYQHAALLGWNALNTETRQEIFKVALEIATL